MLVESVFHISRIVHLIFVDDQYCPSRLNGEERASVIFKYAHSSCVSSTEQIVRDCFTLCGSIVAHGSISLLEQLKLMSTKTSIVRVLISSFVKNVKTMSFDLDRKVWLSMFGCMHSGLEHFACAH